MDGHRAEVAHAVDQFVEVFHRQARVEEDHELAVLKGFEEVEEQVEAARRLEQGVAVPELGRRGVVESKVDNTGGVLDGAVGESALASAQSGGEEECDAHALEEAHDFTDLTRLEEVCELRELLARFE